MSSDWWLESVRWVAESRKGWVMWGRAGVQEKDGRESLTEQEQIPQTQQIQSTFMQRKPSVYSNVSDTCWTRWDKNQSKWNENTEVGMDR